MLSESPSKAKRSRYVLSDSLAASDREMRKTLEMLGVTVLGQCVRFGLSRLRNKQLEAAFQQEHRKNKRQKKVIEELRSSEGLVILIMSPTKIQRARDPAMRRERQKEQLVRDRHLKAENRITEKPRM